MTDGHAESNSIDATGPFTSTTAHNLMDGALAGLTVLDLTRVLTGPYGTMILGDFWGRDY